MDRKFILIYDNPGNDHVSLCHVGGSYRNPFLMSEEEALARLGDHQRPIRVFEVVERKVETRKVIV